MSNSIGLPNPHLEHMQKDFLYHLGFDTKVINFEEMFGDVRVVCMGGTKSRMQDLAKYLQKILGIQAPLEDLAEKAHRYAVYKVGPVLCVSHGIGMASMSVLLHEIIKLVRYAKCKDPILIRLGTSGGVGIDVGSVVVSNKVFNGYLKNEFELPILGKKVCRPAVFSEEVIEKLAACGQPTDDFKTILGGTMGADDFYEGQGRLDGAACIHSEEDKMAYLQRMYDLGVRNIEMEAPMFSSLTNFTGIKAGELCVTLLNRLNGDQVTQATVPKHVLEERPFIILGRFVKNLLNKSSTK